MAAAAATGAANSAADLFFDSLAVAADAGDFAGDLAGVGVGVLALALALALSLASLSSRALSLASTSASTSLLSLIASPATLALASAALALCDSPSAAAADVATRATSHCFRASSSSDLDSLRGAWRVAQSRR